jgi:UDP-3-O-[3-hydroxymyristoyl] glucosamine N-acyltransferase
MTESAHLFFAGVFLVAFSIQEILNWTHGRLVNTEELGAQVDGIQVSQPASLKGSKATDLCFFFSRAFEHELPFAQAGILIVGEPFVQPMKAAQLPFWKKTAIIACQDPYLAMALLSEKFAAQLSTVAHLPSSTQTRAEIHPTAVVHPSVELGNGVKIGPHCVIEEKSKIGDGTFLYSHCVVGPHCSIGKDSVLFSRVTLYENTQVGSRVRLHTGTVLGSDGFGYAPIRQGKQVIGHQKIYHLGYVVIEDDVETGANVTIDRGTLGETRIRKNAKLDNQVHIAHNCLVDEGAIICGGTCLAGNVSVGRYAYIGGVVGISNHVHIGEGAFVAAMTLVSKDVPPGKTVAGTPQRDHKEHFKVHALLSKMLDERRKK